MRMKYIIPTGIAAVACIALLLGNSTKTNAGSTGQPTQTSQIKRGEYLVKFGDCSACHTPLKFSEHGPEPDMTKFLSGHPENTKLPPPNLKPGPWFAVTAGRTAWAGP